VPEEGRNKDKPNENKKAKEKLMKETEASSLRDKGDEIVKSKENFVHKTLETKILIADKKIQD
jgi:hypothetical protein